MIYGLIGMIVAMCTIIFDAVFEEVSSFGFYVFIMLTWPMVVIIGIIEMNRK